jgi:hypothetical protein
MPQEVVPAAGAALRLCMLLMLVLVRLMLVLVLLPPLLHEHQGAVGIGQKRHITGIYLFLRLWLLFCCD